MACSLVISFVARGLGHPFDIQAPDAGAEAQSSLTVALPRAAPGYQKGDGPSSCAQVVRCSLFVACPSFGPRTRTEPAECNASIKLSPVSRICAVTVGTLFAHGFHIGRYCSIAYVRRTMPQLLLNTGLRSGTIPHLISAPRTRRP